MDDPLPATSLPGMSGLYPSGSQYHYVNMPAHASQTLPPLIGYFSTAYQGLWQAPRTLTSQTNLSPYPPPTSSPSNQHSTSNAVSPQTSQASPLPSPHSQTGIQYPAAQNSVLQITPPQRTATTVTPTLASSSMVVNVSPSTKGSQPFGQYSLPTSSPSNQYPTSNAVSPQTSQPPLRPSLHIQTGLPYRTAQNGVLQITPPQQTATLVTPTLGSSMVVNVSPSTNGLHPFGQQPVHTPLHSPASVFSSISPRPTHVVGQQGRRGILPSAPGRKAAVPGKLLQNMTKDSDGKYQCRYCNNKYLHAKHLKRHHLRREFTKSARASIKLLTSVQIPANVRIIVDYAKIHSPAAIS
jgi:hypothetical protein